MVERCRRVVGVADARKWGHVSAATFARLDQVHFLITDSAAPPDLVREIREQGVEVILAD
jgi:DeoR/GlpR family transcriptional regulator of sugar metabolism